MENRAEQGRHMNKLALLALTTLAIYAVIDSIRWLRMTQRFSHSEFEKIAGYDGSKLEPSAREQKANFSKHNLPIKVIVIMGVIAVVMARTTYKAFFH